ncbi:MAG TPA: carboxypeptidase-like regulatory domain-containing protein [Kofleriaceae bacterium]
MLAGGAAFAKPQIAVLGLEVLDKSGSPTPTDARVAEELTHELRNRASQPNGPYSLAPNADKELIDLTLVKQCDEEKPTCMQGIGKDLNADILLYGHIEKQGASYQVTMYLFDVGQRKRDKTYPETIPLSETSSPALAGWARKIYGKLTGQNDACTILVKTNGVDAGTILVNGSPKGNITNGVGQVGGLGEGRYRIAVEAKDYHRWEKSDVTCTAGQTTTVPADMERQEVATPTGPGSTPVDNGGHEMQGTVSQSGHGPWLVVAIGAGAVAVGAVATGFYASDKLRETDYGHDCETDNNGNITGDKAHPGLNGPCSNGPTYKNLQYPMYIGAGVLAGVAAVAVYEYLHHGDDEHPNTVAGHRKHHEPFVVVPVATPDGGGVTFSMTW